MVKSSLFRTYALYVMFVLAVFIAILVVSLIYHCTFYSRAGQNKMSAEKSQELTKMKDSLEAKPEV